MRSITLKKKKICPMLAQHIQWRRMWRWRRPHPVEEDVALEAQQLEVYFIIEKPSCI